MIIAFFIMLAIATVSFAADEPAHATEGAAMQDVHAQLSTACFNECWNYLDKKERTTEDVENMVVLAATSLWHWKQRTDCQPMNLSVGYWQVSRAFAEARQHQPATFFGQRCLDVSRDHALPPFYLGYAHEAMARAEALAGNQEASHAHWVAATEQLELVTDEEAKALLEADLKALGEAVATR